MNPLSVVEQVTEVRGAEAVLNLWQQGVWEAVLPRQFRFYGVPNLTRLEYFSQIIVI